VHPLCPDHYCRSLRELDFSLLARQGRVHVCLDLDNTIALRESLEPAEGIPEALARARREGHVEAFCLVSNIIWGRHRRQRLEHFARILDIPHYYGALIWNRKPSARPFREAMRMMGSEPRTTAIVGDQIFTDVAGGKRLGLYTVLVQPLGPDHWTTFWSGRRRQEIAILESSGMSLHPEEPPPADRDL
jgi:hypothetical protein